jgi:hypothetical protein
MGLGYENPQNLVNGKTERREAAGKSQSLIFAYSSFSASALFWPLRLQALWQEMPGGIAIGIADCHMGAGNELSALPNRTPRQFLSPTAMNDAKTTELFNTRSDPLLAPSLPAPVSSRTGGIAMHTGRRCHVASLHCDEMFCDLALLSPCYILPT